MSSASASLAPDVDLTIELEHNHLYNADLAPVPGDRRKWRVGSFAALWISMSACIPTYMLASSLIGGGMNWSQAIFTIFLGNLIVVIPMILNAHAGTPAATAQNVLGITFVQFLCFMFFWAINMLVVYKGIDCIRWLLNIKAPLLIALGLMLLWWAYRNAGGFGPILAQPSAFASGQPKAGQFFSFFVPALTGMIGFWATLSLNIPDFSRYACSQRDQIVGQALGLPLTMALYSFIGVAVTSATMIIYGQTIWDPVDVLTHFTNPIVLVVAMLALSIATLATNIAANVVSPANDFSHVAPHKISFRTGGLITGVVGIIMMPWKLVADPSGYIFTWLVGYSALLGPIGGIMIADYYVLRL